MDYEIPKYVNEITDEMYVKNGNVYTVINEDFGHWDLHTEAHEYLKTKGIDRIYNHNFRHNKILIDLILNPGDIKINTDFTDLIIKTIPKEIYKLGFYDIDSHSDCEYINIYEDQYRLYIWAKKQHKKLKYTNNILDMIKKIITDKEYKSDQKIQSLCEVFDNDPSINELSNRLEYIPLFSDKFKQCKDEFKEFVERGD